MGNDARWLTGTRIGWSIGALLLLGVLGIAAYFSRAHSARPAPSPVIRQQENDPPAARENAGIVVCLDPGHPSEVSAGRTVQHGVTEVAVNWQVAQQLRGMLQAQGFTVVMTKQRENQLVTNRRRAGIANARHAALLLRLHCDTGGGAGITFYYPDRQGTSAGRTGPLPAIIHDSARAAQRIHRVALDVLDSALRDNGIKGDSATLIGRRQGALTGSIDSTVPVVTVEMVFLSNPHDAQFIRSARGQQQMAAALDAGVREYLRPAAYSNASSSVSSVSTRVRAR